MQKIVMNCHGQTSMDFIKPSFWRKYPTAQFILQLEDQHIDLDLTKEEAMYRMMMMMIIWRKRKKMVIIKMHVKRLTVE